MGDTDQARIFVRADGTRIRAAQHGGGAAGCRALIAAFPNRIALHPHRAGAVLVSMTSGRKVRVEAGDWVSEQPDGSLQTDPDDQFRSRQTIVEASAA